METELIVTRAKDLKEIVKTLKDSGFEKIAVIGCGGCATLSGTGGKEQVEEMVRFLGELSFEIVFSTVVETACNERLASRALRQISTKPDCFLVLSCGSGVQNIADVQDAPVVAGLDTLFIGKTKRPGVFFEYCSACGDCILSKTGGICPKSRCPKGVLNGPCGGMFRGKCEVEESKACIWVKIYERTESRALRETFRSNFGELNKRPRETGGQIEQA